MAWTRLPKERRAAALSALRADPPPPAPPAPPMEAGILLDARDRLEADKAGFERDRRLAEAQLQAERAEIERIRTSVEARLEEAGRSVAPSAAAPSLAAAPGSDKGAKAVADLAARMGPKSAAQLLQGEGEESVALILRKMDPKQAGKVMAELLTADSGLAARVTARMMKQGNAP